MDDREHICGALRSPDADDDIYEHIASSGNDTYRARMPDTLDLRHLLGPVRDQGNRPTCAAFAAAAVSTSYTHEEMSPEFIYSRRTNKPADGMYTRNAFAIMQKLGSVAELLLPYQQRDGTKPSRKIKKAAKKNRLTNYARVTSVDGLKRALLESGPAVVVLPCYSSEPRFWWPVGGRGGGGHAVAVVGYTLTGFTLRNSWGTDWADDGHVELPFAEFSIVWEAWCAVV